jgi:hypothetical protein
MSATIRFGEHVQGYSIPVLNEREIRAAAGLLFVLMFVSILIAALRGEYMMIKFATTIFLTDILIRVLVNPRYSPTMILGRLIVRNQVPEYVGAAQKKFAWIIGIILGSTIFVHLVLLNARSPITGIVCLVCLIFLFFETSFGICLGCKVYSMVYKEKSQYCPGEVCNAKSQQDIQRTSRAQVMIVYGFLAYIVLIAFAFNESFSKKPFDLFGGEPSVQSR